MMGEMFCFQCEQTAGCVGCTGRAGVCGKPAAVAGLQDELTGALVGLARATELTPPDAQTDKVLFEGLFTTITNVDFDPAAVRAVIDRVHAEAARLAPDCSGCTSDCGRVEDYDLSELWSADEDLRSVKSIVLFAIRGMSAYAYHALVLGRRDASIGAFMYRALFAIGYETQFERVLPLAEEAGRVNLTCMALLDEANTTTYGNPVPTTVPLTVEPGPFIVVTGHDLRDLELLLEQTDGRGVNVYTHGEMLPAHGYPTLKAHPQLKGNFGTAWQNQRVEFDGIPAPILFTTNCLMPPKASYADRVFTTEVVAYPGLTHVDEVEGTKDFSAVIERAIELGGYPEAHEMHGINGGTEVTTGFGRGFVLDHAGDIVAAVKAGKISHFFLVGGCDGARPGRNYFTEFVKQTPADSFVLTLACGKYRFNDLDLGEVAGLPRILDMGQCNDAYGAVQVALALAGAFGCGVNDLPLSFVLSWYEQKAVAVLLTLLALGVRNIKLGPTLPAFVSPNVLDYLVKTYGLAPTTTPEDDLADFLG